MADFKSMKKEQLQEEKKRLETLLQDAQDERAFLGKQGGMHIKVSEFERLDQDIERYEAKIKEIDELL